MPVAKAINTDTYLNNEDIKKHLQNVEYIIMAAPAPAKFKNTPIHFSIFLNTADRFSDEIKDAIFEKFLAENGIKNPIEVMAQVMPVGFAHAPEQTTYMPMLLIDPKDQRSIPHTPMFVYDFLADSDQHSEAKIHGLTGWTYSYNS